MDVMSDITQGLQPPHKTPKSNMSITKRSTTCHQTTVLHNPDYDPSSSVIHHP